MPNDGVAPAPKSSDQKLLTEIRDNFSYAVEAWRENRREGDIDMRIIAGHPWDDRDISLRGKDRPALVFDEHTQYLNQLTNTVKQNPRGIEVSPKTTSTDGKAAERRAGLIRGIEYASVAPDYVYPLAFESSTRRGEGYWRINKQRVSPRSFDYELVIKPITNPCSVYVDPDAREAAAADMQWCFVIDSIRKKDFEHKYPKATIKSFSSELARSYPQWVKEDSIQVAEYWCVKHKPDTLLGLASQQVLLASELTEGLAYDEKRNILVTPTGMVVPVERAEPIQVPYVTQYHTNGVEILATAEWEGKYIPIVPTWGLTYYYDDGAGVRFVVRGLIRGARDPIKMLNYVRSSEAELVSMLPKAPYVGYLGQFKGVEEDWANAHRKPMPYLEARGRTTETGEETLPLPQRPSYTPDIVALQGLGEECRRGIQAAVGMYNSSVGNRGAGGTVSGVAVQELDKQSDQGSFHFIANFNHAVRHTGRILDDLIPHVYDTEREVASRRPDGRPEVLKVNSPGDPDALDVTAGDFDLGISVGAAFESERAESRAFVEKLMAIPMPGLIEKCMPYLIKLSLTGPVADELGKVLTPADQVDPKEIPPAVVDQMKQQEAAMNELKALLEQAQAELQSKAAENESRERIAAQNNETKILIEQMKAQVDLMLQRMEAQQAMANAQIAAEEPDPEPVGA